MADVFFSYASEDRARAEALVSALERQGWSVWWDQEIPPGTDYQHYIKEKLDAARCVIVLWSAHSVASNWVRAEADSALNRRVLVPVLINGVQPPIPFNTIQTARLADWDGASGSPELDQLLAAVAKRLGEKVEPMPPPRPPGPPWVLIGAVAAHVVAGLALVFVRVSATEVRLELQAEEVGFTASVDQPLISDPMGVTMLGVSGLAAFDLPRSAGPGSESFHEPSLLLTAQPHGDRRGTIHLQPWLVPANTGVSLRRTEVLGEYRLSLEGAIPELGASVLGLVQVVVPRMLTESRDFAAARRIGLLTDSVVIDLEFAMPPEQSTTLASRLTARDVRVHRIERFEGKATEVSTVVAGRLFFVTLGEEGPTLEKGDVIRFARSEGEIRRLQAAGGPVELTFAGRVWGMRMGSGELQQNLMPTVLDWLAAHQWASRLATAYVGLVAVALAAFRWWRKVSTWARRA